MEKPIFSRVRKGVLPAGVNHFKKLRTEEFSETSIPQWQQDEVRTRLAAMKDGKDNGVDWEIAMKKINFLSSI